MAHRQLLDAIRVYSALLKALARGFRWRKLLEIGDCITIAEIVEAENINPSYVSRVLRIRAYDGENDATVSNRVGASSIHLSASHQAVPKAALQAPAALDFHAAFRWWRVTAKR